MARTVRRKKPRFRKGDVVAILNERGHPPEVFEGKQVKIIEVRDGPFYAVIMDGKYHRWFADFELTKVRPGK